MSKKEKKFLERRLASISQFVLFVRSKKLKFWTEGMRMFECVCVGACLDKKRVWVLVGEKESECASPQQRVGVSGRERVVVNLQPGFPVLSFPHFWTQDCCFDKVAQFDYDFTTMFSYSVLCGDTFRKLIYFFGWHITHLILLLIQHKELSHHQIPSMGKYSFFGFTKGYLNELYTLIKDLLQKSPLKSLGSLTSPSPNG